MTVKPRAFPLLCESTNTHSCDETIKDKGTKNHEKATCPSDARTLHESCQDELPCLAAALGLE
jgi:hypothetical protein